MAEDKKAQQDQLNIEISEQMAEGGYANLAIITHSPSEFVFDFVNIMPGTPKSKVKSRMIMAPMHAKRFLQALLENVENYEKQFGKIRDYSEATVPLDLSNNVKGQA